MRAARLGKIMKGQIKNLTERERIALDWCKDHTYEMPDEKWMEQSENHYEAFFLIPDIYHYRSVHDQFEVAGAKSADVRRCGVALPRTVHG